MRLPSAHDVTDLLRAWSEGDHTALEKLMPLVYDELHRLAHHYMSCEKPGHLLQTTALVNEAYLRLIDASQVSWQNRAHFFAISAQLMRRILVEFARSRRRQKRGAGIAPTCLDEGLMVSVEPGVDLMSLDEALKALAAINPRQSQVVELRFFGGLSVEQTAEVLKVSPETVMRDWKLTKAWLLRAMDDEKFDEAGTMESR
jgi:RNA polymerase sigma factor (TIGR02999 family)